MRELLSENEQLSMRNLQPLCRRGDFRRTQQSQFSLSWGLRACFCFSGLGRFYHIDPNRNAVLRFNLTDRYGAICAVEHPFNQTALRVSRTISKLWHRRRKIIGNGKSETGKWLRPLNRSNALTVQTNHDHAKIFLSPFRNLITPRDMKCAAAITLVSVALVSQAMAVLRPLFPAKSSPPFNGGAITIGDSWIRHLPQKAPATAAKKARYQRQERRPAA